MDCTVAMVRLFNILALVYFHIALSRTCPEECSCKYASNNRYVIACNGQNLTSFPRFNYNVKDLENVTSIDLYLNENEIAHILVLYLNSFHGKLRVLELQRNRRSLLIPPTVLDKFAGSLEVVKIDNIATSVNEALQLLTPLINLRTLKISTSNPDRTGIQRVFSSSTRLDRLKNYSDGKDVYPNLRALQLCNCDISTVAKDAFYDFSALKSLSLAHNVLTSVPRALDHLLVSNLEELDLGYNRIEVLSDSDFPHLCKLRVLNLGYNELVRIDPFSFSRCPMLCEISVASNARLASVKMRPYTLGSTTTTTITTTITTTTSGIKLDISKTSVPSLHDGISITNSGGLREVIVEGSVMPCDDSIFFYFWKFTYRLKGTCKAEDGADVDIWTYLLLTPGSSQVEVESEGYNEINEDKNKIKTTNLNSAPVRNTASGPTYDDDSRVPLQNQNPDPDSQASGPDGFLSSLHKTAANFILNLRKIKVYSNSDQTEDQTKDVSAETKEKETDGLDPRPKSKSKLDEETNCDNCQKQKDWLWETLINRERLSQSQRATGEETTTKQHHRSSAAGGCCLCRDKTRSDVDEELMLLESPFAMTMKTVMQILLLDKKEEKERGMLDRKPCYCHLGTVDGEEGKRLHQDCEDIGSLHKAAAAVTSASACDGKKRGFGDEGFKGTSTTTPPEGTLPGQASSPVSSAPPIPPPPKHQESSCGDGKENNADPSQSQRPQQTNTNTRHQSSEEEVQEVPGNDDDPKWSTKLGEEKPNNQQQSRTTRRQSNEVPVPVPVPVPEKDAPETSTFGEEKNSDDNDKNSHDLNQLFVQQGRDVEDSKGCSKNNCKLSKSCRHPTSTTTITTTTSSTSERHHPQRPTTTTTSTTTTSTGSTSDLHPSREQPKNARNNQPPTPSHKPRASPLSPSNEIYQHMKNHVGNLRVKNDNAETSSSTSSNEKDGEKKNSNPPLPETLLKTKPANENRENNSSRNRGRGDVHHDDVIKTRRSGSDYGTVPVFLASVLYAQLVVAVIMNQGSVNFVKIYPSIEENLKQKYDLHYENDININDMKVKGESDNLLTSEV